MIAAATSAPRACQHASAWAAAAVCSPGARALSTSEVTWGPATAAPVWSTTSSCSTCWRNSASTCLSCSSVVAAPATYIHTHSLMCKHAARQDSHCTRHCTLQCLSVFHTGRCQSAAHRLTQASNCSEKKTVRRSQQSLLVSCSHSVLQAGQQANALQPEAAVQTVSFRARGSQPGNKRDLLQAH